MLCGLYTGGGNETPGEKELARLEGVWSFVIVEVEGAKRPPMPFETNKIIISKDGRYIVVQGLNVTRGTLSVDPTKTPMHYTPVVATGSAKGLVAMGIYDLQGETLKLCLPLGGKERPTKFATAAGSNLILFVLKRETKEIAPAMLEAARAELAATWQSETYALDGKKTPEKDLKKLKLTIDLAGKATLRREGEVLIESAIKVDPGTSPMQIDVQFTAGDAKGKTSLGICKIEDDLLTICRAATGQARPMEFISTPGSGLTLMTYKREKVAGK
jgi:uncharacterized protein (TIGR03067 family)